MSDPPVWDGSGVDPWLPARLAAMAEIVDAERTIRGSLWAAFAEWIVAVRRGVLATVRPDPIAVYARSPQWASLVDQVVSGPIRDAVGLAYRSLLGTGYRYDQRAAVVEYLASSTNRLVRVPDEVHSVVASQIARGASEGESIPDITRRVEEVLSTTDTPRWPNRATVISRTECLLGDAIIASDGVEAVYRRWHDGPIFRVHTASGNQFSGTTNHPILTSRGWVGFGRLVPGDELICNSFAQGVRTATDEYVSDVPSSIGQVYDALAAVGIVVRTKTGEPDFHGDGVNGYVDVATTNRVLANRIESANGKHVEDLIFESPYSNSVLLPGARDFLTVGCDSGFAHDAKWMETSLNRVCRHAVLAGEIRCARPGKILAHQLGHVDVHPSRPVVSANMELGVLRFLHSTQRDTTASQYPFDDIRIGLVDRCQPSHTLPRGVLGYDIGGINVVSPRERNDIMLSANRYPSVGQYGFNTSSMDAVRLLDGIDAAARPVGTDHVVRVDVVPFSGHVYNLTTRRGWFNYGPLYSGNTLGALNAGRSDAFAAVAEDLGTPFEKMWISTLDDRVRDSHRKADGQRVAVGGVFTLGGDEGNEGAVTLRHPGDPLGPIGETIQCLRGDTIVEFGSVRAITRRWYEGEMIELCFASGDKLAVTPNHPILRADGRWTPAHLLNEGDDCVGAFGRGRLLGQPYEHRGPSEVCELYRAASLSPITQRVRVSPPDFHGDGLDGDVEVVSVDGELGFHGDAASDNQVDEFGLALADLAASPKRGTDRGALMPRISVSHADIAGSCGGVCGRCEPSTLVGGEPLHAQTVGVTASAHRHASGRQSPDDRWPADAERFSESVDALASDVSVGDVLDVNGDALREANCLGVRAELDTCVAEKPRDRCDAASVRLGERWGALASQVATSELVSINRYRFAGHVYNLDTGVGWYIGNCIAVRNCRCTTLLVKPGETIDLTHRQFRNY